MAPTKRQRVDEPVLVASSAAARGETGTPRSLHRPISPPPPSAKQRKMMTDVDSKTGAREEEQEGGTKEQVRAGDRRQDTTGRLLPSPFRLTHIRDLGPDMNVDAVTLADLLGDPLISECWEFNYLHDVNFLMSHFDADTRALVKVNIVHGFWKQEDSGRKSLEHQASRHSNVKLHTAYMPEMFGTHHSKMLILFRHDDTAQVVIHTANMIAKDWTNMTEAVWQSPLLPLGVDSGPQPPLTVGSGHKFKLDLLNYLRAYNSRGDVCKALVEQLAKYDFSAVRGALIASVPGRHEIEDEDADATSWGWAAVRKTMRSVPVQSSGKSEIVAQVSSIATLGPKDTWLRGTLLDSFTSPAKCPSLKPIYRVVFPTPDEIRRSLDGYASGRSIHMKIQSAQQVKQLDYMRPMLCHWANDAEGGAVLPGEPKDAGRQRAAPHIKTYIRYHKDSNTIDWALLTSANISKQAWGEAGNAAGDIRIASWEIGVMVWPELLTDDPAAKMVGSFTTDTPSQDDVVQDDNDKATSTIVGLRIPYNLPLRRYGAVEVPWVATASYAAPDWLGKTWA